MPGWSHEDSQLAARDWLSILVTMPVSSGFQGYRDGRYHSAKGWRCLLGLRACAHPPGACLSPILPQPLGPALRVSFPVPTAAASLGAGNAMGTMTVQMAQMRWAGRPEEGRIRAGPLGCPDLTRTPAPWPTERLYTSL